MGGWEWRVEVYGGWRTGRVEVVGGLEQRERDGSLLKHLSDLSSGIKAFSPPSPQKTKARVLSKTPAD